MAVNDPSPAADNTTAAAQITPEPTGPALRGQGAFGFNEAELVRKAERVEVLISKCMGDVGFEYVAVDWDTVKAGMSTDKNLSGLPEDEFVKACGFGISTLYTGTPSQLNEVPIPQNVGIFRNLPTVD